MTAKRDLKKRIRDRQAKTGESYTTARRHVLAAREDDGRGDDAHLGPDDPTNPGAARPDDAPDDPTNPGATKPDDRGSTLEVVDLTNRERLVDSGDRFTEELKELVAQRAAPSPIEESETTSHLREPIQVDEVIDVSDAAREVGIACKVLVYERLAKAVEPRLAMIAMRDALVAYGKDPATYVMRAVVAGEVQKLHIAAREAVPRDPEFMAKIAAGLTAVSKDGRMIAVHVNGFAGMVTVVCAVWRKQQTLIMTTPDDRIGPVLAGFGAGDALFLVYEGRRYKITREPFVIGRHPSCDLQIKDGYISRKHVAIVQRHGTYYILDLGSHAGLDYRGMRISNKRIDEGDLFMMREYALRFTFHETDA